MSEIVKMHNKHDIIKKLVLLNGGNVNNLPVLLDEKSVYKYSLDVVTGPKSNQEIYKLVIILDEIKNIMSLKFKDKTNVGYFEDSQSKAVLRIQKFLKEDRYSIKY